jgi:hypothetical protein
VPVLVLVVVLVASRARLREFCTSLLGLGSGGMITSYDLPAMGELRVRFGW